MSDPTETEEREAALAAGFSDTVPNLVVKRYGRFDDPNFKQVFRSFILERRRTRALCQALRDIREGKDNPCVIVINALAARETWG